MKVLIAILSCHSHKHYEQAQRDTWIPDIPAGVDYKFFLGNHTWSPCDPDEVVLNVGDAFADVTAKTVEMNAWALVRDYDFVFKADLDTLVRPKELLVSGFEQHDYTGGRNSFFVSGGAGYWLSKRALQAVVETEIEPGPAEDVNTAHALAHQGIQLHADPRYKFYPGDVMDDYTLTYHLSSIRDWAAKYEPGMMYQAYSDQKNGVYKSYVKRTEPVRRFRRLI